MNRTEFFILNKSAEVYTPHIDIAGVVSFLSRQRRINNFQVIARKGKRAIFIEKIESEPDLIRELTEFQNQNA